MPRLQIKIPDTFAGHTFAGRHLRRPRLAFYDANGTTRLAFNDDAPGTTDSLLLDAVVPSDGAFFVRVSGFGSQTGDYELFAYRFEATAVPEPVGLGGLALLGVAASRRRPRPRR